MIEELKGKEEKVLRVGDGFSNIIQIGEVQGKEIKTLCSKPKKISSNQIQCINARKKRKKEKIGFEFSLAAEWCYLISAFDFH
jgi:hypothetical protein